MTAGNRSQNYQLAFTEPFLFDRNITGGFDIYKRSLQYIGYYTQRSTGGNIMFGFPVKNFSRMFVNYAYETTKMGDLNEALIDIVPHAGGWVLDHLVAGRPVAVDADAGGLPVATLRL
jgi:outer membrane protein insertion porin family